MSDYQLEILLSYTFRRCVDANTVKTKDRNSSCYGLQHICVIPRLLGLSCHSCAPSTTTSNLLLRQLLTKSTIARQLAVVGQYQPLMVQMIECRWWVDTRLLSISIRLFMVTDFDALLRISTQIALLGMVTKSIRAISFDVEPEKHLVRFRAHFDGSQHEIELENISAVTSEVMSHFPWGWDIEEQFITCKEPNKPEHLRLVGYVRCESPDFLPPT